MGDRWNMHNDEIMARKYREETPLSWRILYVAVDLIKVLVPVAILVVVGSWLRSKGYGF